MYEAYQAKQSQTYDIMYSTQYGHHFASFFEYISMEACVTGACVMWKCQTMVFVHVRTLPFLVIYDMDIIGKHFLSTFTWQ